MKVLFISLIVCSTCFCQENPWKSNKPVNSSSSIQNGTNPWASNVERDNTQYLEKAYPSKVTKSKLINLVLIIIILWRSNCSRYSVGIPVFGILSLPLVPLITAIPMENKERPIVNNFKENNPEASSET